eukprot:SAG25_NODE_193_length_12184_cov_5.527844_1_plen_81_part_00
MRDGVSLRSKKFLSLAELTDPDCEKSTAGSMARWNRPRWPHVLSHRAHCRLFRVRSNQLSRPPSVAKFGLRSPVTRELLS